MTAPRRAGRRTALLLALLLLTLSVLLLDRAGLTPAPQLRAAGASALGPLERVLGRGGETLAEVTAERDRLRASAGADEASRRAEAALQDLLDAPALHGIPLVPARVVAAGRSGAAGVERLTIDVGSRDGIEVDQTVVAGSGLVGRTVSVGAFTSDVLLLGAAGLVVGVRAGDSGLLGSVEPAAATGVRPRARGLLDLRLVQRGTLVVGAPVTTLGSVDGSPFLPGIPVGTVASVDADPAALTSTGAVRPAVDAASLDVVGVLQPEARTAARPAVTPTGGPA